MTDRPRVLIVEDHEILRVMLFAVLRQQRLAVDTARSAGEALEKMTVCDYALVLLDMDLADGSAAKFLHGYRVIRPNGTFVVAVRNPSDDRSIDPAVVSAILNKPLDLGTLAEVVRECASVMPSAQETCGPAESDFFNELQQRPQAAG